MKIVIIGGGSAGTTCAFELRKMDKEADITIIERSAFTQYSPCALPYLLSGEIKSRNDIIVFGENDYANNRINLLLKTEAKRIDTRRNYLHLSGGRKIKYDYLVVSTGSRPKRPPIKGIEAALPFTTLTDCMKMKKLLKGKKRIAVIGAGLTGVEVAHALATLGKKVTLLEYEEYILGAMLDGEMAERVQEYLSEEGIKLMVNARIREVRRKKILLEEGIVSHDLAVCCTGLEPEVTLAKDAGIKTGKGIIVDEYMRTSERNIYACGDCVETINLLTGEREVSMLGTNAVREAVVVAKNILGKGERFPPVVNAAVSRIGRKYIGSVGITKRKASDHKIRALSAEYTTTATAEYYPSNDKITSFLISDTRGRIIGCQIISDINITGRINLMSMAINMRMKIGELARMETCYNPASAPIFDPLTVTAEILERKIDSLKSK